MSAASHPQPRAAPQMHPSAVAAEPRIVRLPTPAEITADQVRRRPIGAVLADICRDLGITTDHPLWRGTPAPGHPSPTAATLPLLTKDIFKRVSAWLIDPRATEHPAESPLPPGRRVRAPPPGRPDRAFRTIEASRTGPATAEVPPSLICWPSPARLSLALQLAGVTGPANRQSVKTGVRRSRSKQNPQS